MHAPDGVTTTAVCRDNSGPTIRNNTLAPIKKWEERNAIPKVEAVDEKWACPVCAQVLASRSSYMGHYTSNHSQRRVCVVCGREFTTPSSHSLHLRAHPELKPPAPMIAVEKPVEVKVEDAVPASEPKKKSDEKSPAAAPAPEKREVAKVPAPKAEVAKSKPSTPERAIDPKVAAGLVSIHTMKVDDLLELSNAVNRELAKRVSEQSARLNLILEAATM